MLQRAARTVMAALVLCTLASPAAAATGQLVFRHVTTRHRAVAITINDGPDTRVVPAMLRLLQENGARATFFVTAVSLEEDPAIMLEIRDEGSEIGNHAYHHNALAHRPYRDVEGEVQRAQQLLSLAGTQPPQFLRPPYGGVDRQVREVARRQGLRIALWDIGNANETLQSVPDQLRPGDIISLRDDRKGMEILKGLLRVMDRQHLRGVTLRELVAYGS